MNKTFVALAAAITLAAALPSSAQANCGGCGVAAGVVGGLAAGAIIGSAIANSGPRYVEPAPVYAPPPPAYAEPPAYARRSGLPYRAPAGMGRLRLPDAPRPGVRLDARPFVPAKAGTQFLAKRLLALGPRFRGDDRTSGIECYRRMWSSTAAVGQQSTFSPFFF